MHILGLAILGLSFIAYIFAIEKTCKIPDTTEELLGDYFELFIAGIFFLGFFAMTFQTFNEVFTMITSGITLHKLNKINARKPLIKHKQELQQMQEAEYFLGTYDGVCNAYLLLDTVQYFSIPHEDGEEYCYTCTVKVLDLDSQKISYDYYELVWYQSETLIKNGKGYGFRGMSQIYEMPAAVEMQLIYYLREPYKNTSSR